MRLADHVRLSTEALGVGMRFEKPFAVGADGTPRAESAYGVRFLFTGREWLASLGLYDYCHRAYSPTLGRFLQVDVISLWDGMRYVKNSPLCLLDPLGWQTLRRDVKEFFGIRRELSGLPSEPTNSVVDELRTGTLRTVKDVTEAAFDPVGAVVDKAVKQVPGAEKVKDVYDLTTEPKKWLKKKAWDRLWDAIDYAVRKLTEWPEQERSNGVSGQGTREAISPKEEGPCKRKGR